MRPVWMLSATQALCMSGSFLFVLLGGIIGSQLAPTPALATLPVSLLIAGVAASVVPAGALIQRFGRRAVFVGCALQAAAGCVLAGFAVATGRYWLFCTAAFLLGANNAVVMQYRFAATEYVEPARASRAIAVVMTGALVAAWLGPELAVRTADLVPAAHYAGSFYAGPGSTSWQRSCSRRSPSRRACTRRIRRLRGASARSRRSRSIAWPCSRRSRPIRS